MTGVRRQLKLDRALNVPRRAPGRLSKAFEALGRDKSQLLAVVATEDNARKAQPDKEAKLVSGLHLNRMKNQLWMHLFRLVACVQTTG